MDSIIEQLQKTKEYTVTEIGGEGEKVNKITNYRAINSKTHEADVVKEISNAEIVRPRTLITQPCHFSRSTFRLPALLDLIF